MLPMITQHDYHKTEDIFIALFEIYSIQLNQYLVCHNKI